MEVIGAAANPPPASAPTGVPQETMEAAASQWATRPSAIRSAHGARADRASATEVPEAIDLLQRSYCAAQRKPSYRPNYSDSRRRSSSNTVVLF